MTKCCDLFSHFQLEEKLLVDFSTIVDTNQFLFYPQIWCKSAGFPYIQRPRMFLDAGVSMWKSESNTGRVLPNNYALSFSHRSARDKAPKESGEMSVTWN